MVSHAFPPTVGGVETHLWDLSHELAHRGHEVRCLVGGKTSVQRLGPITVVREPHLTAQYLIAQRKNVKSDKINNRLLSLLCQVVLQTIESFRPQIIHIHNAHHFAPELALAFFQQRMSTPMFNGIHDRVGDNLYPQVLLGDWAHTIFASHYLIESLSHLTNGPQSVLHLGIDLRCFAPGGGFDDRLTMLERPIIFHPARLLRWKGVVVGLEAFIELKRRIGKGTLVLCESPDIADDPSQVRQLRMELEERSNLAGVGASVRFFSFQRSEMAAAYRTCDLVWYPTIDEEPFGLVPLEAMAAGVPLLVSDSGGMRETIPPIETDIVVPKNDPHSLTSAALRLLTDKSCRARVIEAGIRRVQCFDIRSYTTSLEKIYSGTPAKAA